MFLFGVGKRCVSVTLVVEYRLRPGVLRGLGGSRRLEWPQMPRLRLPNYPEKEYFAHRLTFSDKMARKAARSSKKAGPLPNLPGKFWWRRGESNGVCAARIRGACSAKRATGTFRGPRNAGGVRFSNTAVITKKQAGFPDLLGFFGGGAENRTPVHTRSPTGPYKLVQRFEFGCETPVGGLLCILAGSILA